MRQRTQLVLALCASLLAMDVIGGAEQGPLCGLINEKTATRVCGLSLRAINNGTLDMLVHALGVQHVSSVSHELAVQLDEMIDSHEISTAPFGDEKIAALCKAECSEVAYRVVMRAMHNPEDKRLYEARLRSGNAREAMSVSAEAARRSEDMLCGMVDAKAARLVCDVSLMDVSNATLSMLFHALRLKPSSPKAHELVGHLDSILATHDSRMMIGDMCRNECTGKRPDGQANSSSGVLCRLVRDRSDADAATYSPASTDFACGVLLSNESALVGLLDAFDVEPSSMEAHLLVGQLDSLLKSETTVTERVSGVCVHECPKPGSSQCAKHPEACVPSLAPSNRAPRTLQAPLMNARRAAAIAKCIAHGLSREMCVGAAERAAQAQHRSSFDRSRWSGWTSYPHPSPTSAPDPSPAARDSYTTSQYSTSTRDLSGSENAIEEEEDRQARLQDISAGLRHAAASTQEEAFRKAAAEDKAAADQAKAAARMQDRRVPLMRTQRRDEKPPIPDTSWHPPLPDAPSQPPPPLADASRGELHSEEEQSDAWPHFSAGQKGAFLRDIDSRLNELRGKWAAP